MRLDENKFKKMHGYEEGKDVLDPVSLSKAAEYKKNVLKNFTPIDQNQIAERFTTGEYHITRKYDGEYAIIFFTDGQAVTVNRSGRTRRGIPCIDEAAALLRASGIKEGIFPAEIYVEAGYKTRVNDLISALGSKGDITTLRLAVFDILDIDGRPFGHGSYTETWNKIHEIFGKGKLCHPVDYRTASTGNEILDLWKQWVDIENSEGLIVHTRIGFTYKIKPRHYFDAVVIAYGEGSGVELGQVRRMLFAFMPRPNQYQIMSRVGSGLNEKLRKELYQFFDGKQVQNPVTGINPKWDDLVFVRPELVIEIAVEEIVTEMASGEKTNHLLTFDGKEYKYEGIVPGYRTYTPVFIRLREDKCADPEDAGTAQIERFLNSSQTVFSPRNKLLLRDVLLNHDTGATVSYFFWQRQNDTLVLARIHRKHGLTDRTLRNGRSIFDLNLQYGKMAYEDISNGYVRDNDQLIFTDELHELMQMEQF